MKTINQLTTWYATNHLESKDVNTCEKNQAQLMVLNVLKAYQLTGATSSELAKCLLSLLDDYNNLDLEDYALNVNIYIVECIMELHKALDYCLQ